VQASFLGQLLLGQFEAQAKSPYILPYCSAENL